MLRLVYEQFGFFPTLFLSVAFILFVIFWAAGIAGLIGNRERRKSAEWATYALCILIPAYPVIWLIADIFRQYWRITRKAVKTVR
jgi:hypothetical protein